MKRNKIAEIITQTHKTPLEQADEILLLFDGSNQRELYIKCINEQEEIICSPIRFNGVHVNKIKEVFLKNGIEVDEIGF